MHVYKTQNIQQYKKYNVTGHTQQDVLGVLQNMNDIKLNTIKTYTHTR